jgi:hypothetical protein
VTIGNLFLASVILAGVGAPTPAASRVEMPSRIAISDSVAGLGPNAAPNTVYSRYYVISRSGATYTRYDGALLVNGSSDTADRTEGTTTLSSELVANFVRTIDAFRYPVPTAEVLRLTSDQRAILAMGLARCQYKGDIPSALLSYYQVPELWTDDDPSIKVEIDYANGRVSRIESHNQQLFALPWRIGLSNGREAKSYDPAISLALLPLLGKGSLNAYRLNGESKFRTEDPFGSVSYVACNGQETERH